MVGGSIKDGLDASKAVNVHQYAEVMKGFLGELQPNQPRRSVFSQKKSIPSGLFCMSGPVAHVDDDDDEEEEEGGAANNEVSIDINNDYNNGLDTVHAQIAEPYPFEKKTHGSPFQKKKKHKKKKKKKKKQSLSCENLFLSFNEKNRGEAEHTNTKWPESAIYEGEIGFDEQISGWGKASWTSGTFYEGEIMAGNLHGVGTLKSPDGSIYKGNWILNKKHGFGRKMYANGDIYEGSWKWDLPEGQGRYGWSNGNEYYGNWKNGMMCGRGILMWSCGDKYDGHWLDGLADGHGVYTWADGSSYFGNWKKGTKVGKGRFISSDSQILLEKEYLQEYAKLSHIDHDVYDDGGCYVIDEEMESSHVVGTYNRPKVCSPSHVPKELRKMTQSFPNDKFRQLLVNGEETHFLERLCRCGSLKEGSLSRCFDASHGKLKNKGEVLEESQRNQQRKLPGEIIYKGHRSYDFMLNLQLGIRYSVGNVTPKPRRKPVPADFGPKARIRMNFPREGSQLTPSHSSTDFKWKDYCPLVFRHLRETFGIDAAEYMLSICGNEGLRELSSPGKSGSIFYLSHNERFIIKTLRKVEVKALLKMLPRYYDHVQNNKNTLLTRFYGLHRINPTTGQKVRFMVMGNVISCESQIHRRFDLKGSSQGRSTERESDTDYGTTLKDLDLDLVFQLDTTWKDIVLGQISKDCKFLESERIMDYSLLLGVHFSKPTIGPQENKLLKEQGHPLASTTQADARDEFSLTLEKERCIIQIGSNMPAIASRKLEDGRDEVYEVRLYFGIIDILQEYDMGKRLEHAYKSIQFDSLSISAVDPELYSKRFQLFLSDIFREKT